MLRESVLALVVTGGIALSGCGSDSNCIILANGGNKLCGDDAKAWCDTTDNIRDDAGQLGADVASSQEACDQIRGR